MCTGRTGGIPRLVAPCGPRSNSGAIRKETIGGMWPEGHTPIYYTDFGDLGSLLQNNWPDFEDLFPDRNWILARIGELELSRNIIAHSNTLDERELLRIRLYLQDWIKQVG